MVTALNRMFGDMMASHPSLVFLGQDVRSPYGGAFKVSRGLSDAFPERVLNTPISEAAIAGIGCGLAMRGYRPFVEIMFGDFTTLIADQLINHAAKLAWLTDGSVPCDLVIRTPMGGGRGYGPTHSQSLERLFLGVPGLRVLALNNLMEPDRVYAPLLAGNPGVTLVIENKRLYATFLRDRAPRGFRLELSDEPFPTALLRPESEEVDLTLLGYGGASECLVAVADRLFEEHEIIAQVICPTQIYPFGIDALAAEIARAPYLVIVEEGQGFAGFGAEVAAQLAQRGFRGAIRRVAPAPIPVPAAESLEKAALISEEKVLAEVLELIGET